MIEFAINLLALILSLFSLYCTTLRNEFWIRRLGCIVGIVACCLNMYLLRYGPWSGILLTAGVLALNVKGAALPDLIRRLT